MSPLWLIKTYISPFNALVCSELVELKKIQRSPSSLMKTNISLYYRTSSIQNAKGRLSSQENEADMFTVYFGKSRGESPDVFFCNRVQTDETC